MDHEEPATETSTEPAPRPTLPSAGAITSALSIAAGLLAAMGAVAVGVRASYAGLPIAETYELMGAPPLLVWGVTLLAFATLGALILGPFSAAMLEERTEDPRPESPGRLPNYALGLAVLGGCVAGAIVAMTLRALRVDLPTGVLPVLSLAAGAAVGSWLVRQLRLRPHRRRVRLLAVLPLSAYGAVGLPAGIGMWFSVAGLALYLVLDQARVARVMDAPWRLRVALCCVIALMGLFLPAVLEAEGGPVSYRSAVITLRDRRHPYLYGGFVGRDGAQVTIVRCERHGTASTHERYVTISGSRVAAIRIGDTGYRLRPAYRPTLLGLLLALRPDGGHTAGTGRLLRVRDTSPATSAPCQLDPALQRLYPRSIRRSSTRALSAPRSGPGSTPAPGGA